jgi:hypothetical protein
MTASERRDADGTAPGEFVARHGPRRGAAFHIASALSGMWRRWSNFAKGRDTNLAARTLMQCARHCGDEGYVACLRFSEGAPGTWASQIVAAHGRFVLGDTTGIWLPLTSDTVACLLPAGALDAALAFAGRLAANWTTPPHTYEGNGPLPNRNVTITIIEMGLVGEDTLKRASTRAAAGTVWLETLGGASGPGGTERLLCLAERALSFGRASATLVGSPVHGAGATEGKREGDWPRFQDHTRHLLGMFSKGCTNPSSVHLFIDWPTAIGLTQSRVLWLLNAAVELDVAPSAMALMVPSELALADNDALDVAIAAGVRVIARYDTGLVQSKDHLPRAVSDMLFHIDPDAVCSARDLAKRLRFAADLCHAHGKAFLVTAAGGRIDIHEYRECGVDAVIS